MIDVDISHVWGAFSLPDLLAMEQEVFGAHQMLMGATGAGSEHLGWLALPRGQSDGELDRLLAAAARIRSSSEICVVVGIGGSHLGSRAAIELLQGVHHNIGKGQGNPQIFYAGNTLSTRYWNGMLDLLEGKDFSVIVISKSGDTLETGIAFRELRLLLENRFGSEGARQRIYAVTDPEEGALRRMIREQNWESFAIPYDVGGRFSVLSPAGLLPMAVAGIDIRAVLRGAARGMKDYDLRSFENPVWLYTAVRNLMHRCGKAVELLVSYEPGFRCFGSWWQQLFGESEGKDGKGLLPVSGEFTADLYSLGQLIQEGQGNLFETIVRFDPPPGRYTLSPAAGAADEWDFLGGRALDDVERCAYETALSAHEESGVSIITMDCGKLDPRKLGELIYFMELSCGISAYILGVNPFDQPGVERCKREMLSLLGKPESAGV